MVAQSKADSIKATAAPDKREAALETAAQLVGQEIPCAARVEQSLDLPTNALLTMVEVEVVALPAGECPLSQVAETRPMQGDSTTVVIDLKRMRSVAGLTLPKIIESFQTWTGAQFVESGLTLTAGKAIRFQEIATERLAVTCASMVNAEEAQKSGTIILPDAPADLVLTVNGKTAWTHIGPVQLETVTDQPSGKQIVLEAKEKNRLVKELLRELEALAGGRGSKKAVLRLLEDYGISPSDAALAAMAQQLQHGFGQKEFTAKEVEAWLVLLGVSWEGRNAAADRMFSERVDITTLLQDELSAGASTLVVELKAALACRLQLTVPTQEFRRSHQVVFPAQVLTLDVTEEGAASLVLPLPAASSGWQVRTLQCTIKGNAGRSRIVPAVGPQPFDLGQLVLDGDHALAALLTTDILASFQTIEGIRLPLLVEEEGAEITAFLRQADNGKVGAPLPEALFQSQALVQTSNEQWVLLPLDKPIKVTQEVDLWLELRVIRGRCWWTLGNPDEAAPGVVSLQGGVPGGSFAPFDLTLNNQPQHLHGRLRIQGQPVTDGAIPALRVLDPQSGADVLGITTGSGLLALEVHFTEAVQPENGVLSVPLLLHAPGTYTVTEARVIYED